MELVGSLVFQMGRLFWYFGTSLVRLVVVMCYFESIYNCSFVGIFRGGIVSGLLVGEIILVLLQVFSKLELVADLPFFHFR